MELTVELGGDIDLRDRERLRALVDRAAGMGVDRLTFDLTLNTFAGSECLAVFMYALGYGMEVVVRNPPDAFQRAMEVTGVDEVVDTEHDW